MLLIQLFAWKCLTSNMHIIVDLVPPIYVWVGCAYTIQHRENLHARSAIELLRQHQNSAKMDKVGLPGLNFCDEQMYSYSVYSRVALRQSAMDPGHSWHMFVAEERYRLHSELQTDTLDHLKQDVSYHYIGSTLASRGRPSRNIMNDVFEQFSENDVITLH